MKQIQASKIKKQVEPVFKQYGVTKAALFGSASRGDMNQESDIDILVEIKKDISLLDFIGLQQEIEDKLGRKVDLVEYNTLKPQLKQHILKDQVEIL